MRRFPGIVAANHRRNLGGTSLANDRTMSAPQSKFRRKVGISQFEDVAPTELDGLRSQRRSLDGL